MKAKFISLVFIGILAGICHSQSYVSHITVEQVPDGSGLVEICYRAVNPYDTLLALNTMTEHPDSSDWYVSMVTLIDTISEYSGSPNFGWNVSASDTGEMHCFLWDMGTDVGSVEQCDFRVFFAVFDSMLESFGLSDSFAVNEPESLGGYIRSFGLAYRHGELWVLFLNDTNYHCWIRPYSLPDMTPGDSFFIGIVTVGPSDMGFAGDRLFWVEDTRVLLKEYDFETGESNVLRSDWWDLYGTENHLAGVAFDGEKLWVCFCLGMFVALDTADFSLVDTMYFPRFGTSEPATCADGLAWGLGILWCYSNDNIVYAIDTETKTIIHEIPTGEIVDIRGAEGCAWDGVNLWAVDYARGYCYQLSLYEQIRFHISNEFCLDNIPPAMEWLSPICPDLADTFVEEDTVELAWTMIDSNLSGGELFIFQDDSLIFTGISTDTSFDWVVYPWPGYDGDFELFISDSFGNMASLLSCVFYIIERDGVSEMFGFLDSPLLTAAPNPFNSACVITTQSGSGMDIFDMNGRLLVGSSVSSSEGIDYSADSQNNRWVWRPGEDVKSGVYMVRTHIGETTIIRRIVYLK